MGGHWDPVRDYLGMSQNVRAFMSLWESPKPVIAQVHGWCVGGGTDMALCSDLIYMAEDAQIGYPPAQGLGRAHDADVGVPAGAGAREAVDARPGQALTGVEAERVGLVSSAVPEGELEATVTEAAKKMATIPLNQLVMSKLLGEPGLREHGAALEPDAGDDPGRRRAAHTGGDRVAGHGDEGGVSGGGAPARRAVGGLWGRRKE